jgi:hypothetical protein
MRLPFVSRARFEDRELQIDELKQELAELRFKHDRVLDEINFRSTGFHLDPRFATKPDENPPQPAAQPEPEKELTGIAKAIHETGGRPSAVRRYMETESMSNLAQAEAAAQQGRDLARQQEAAKRMSEILESTKNKPAATA